MYHMTQPEIINRYIISDSTHESIVNLHFDDAMAARTRDLVSSPLFIDQSRSSLRDYAMATCTFGSAR